MIFWKIFTSLILVLTITESTFAGFWDIIKKVDVAEIADENEINVANVNLNF